ncbi:hypothetical protein [Aureimonas glaciei]|uniref:Uncharacterized protein n=1 Tax=Aureimonas glaciei TaxID=1776957 RepID=A0A917D9X1_9HYPH|nr:hypothetical protein [Aureimonas glaciei]GGD19950.1 hypothetical protein GCM10011335_23570 [Aureimonas glaciei]
MTKSYFDHVATGELDAATALTMKLAREAGREAGRHVLATAQERADSAAFGLLDYLAAALVRMYGPDDAAAVLRHYADVVGRQADPREADAEA